MSEIIVGVDGSARAEDALAFAQRLAGVTGSSLTLASAYPFEDWPKTAANPEYREFLHQDTQAMLDRIRATLDWHDVATQAIADPSPARALHALAEQDEAALIVVGSSHHGRVGRVLAGSTGERLLHGAPCPVAIVPRDYRTQDEPEIRTIGVGFDGSDESKAALSAATGAALPDDVEADGVFLAGDPARELAAQSEGVDLLMLGSRGYGPRRAVLLGGVSHVVVRDAACPVIVLPRGARAGMSELFAPNLEASA